MCAYLENSKNFAIFVENKNSNLHLINIIMNEIQKYQLSGKLPLPVRNFFGKYIFIPNEGSFTRGIGKQAGLQDLLTSGIVRGNPKGTGMTPKQYNRVRFNGRDKDF